MGALIAVLADVAEIAAEIGMTAEAVVAGEALAAIDSEIAVMSLEGFSVADSLAAMGISGEKGVGGEGCALRNQAFYKSLSF